MNYLKMIGYQNLILLALLQLILRFGFLNEQNCNLALTHFQYVLFVIATLFIFAGGNLIKAIFSQDTYAITKSEDVIIGKVITESNAYTSYAGLTIIGVSIGFYLSYVIERPNFVVFFILIATILYFYATTLKQIMLLGNMMAALSVSLCILLIGIFDLFPTTHLENQRQMAQLFSILLDYAVLLFFIHFVREMIKDLKYRDENSLQGIRTLSGILGISKTTKVIGLLNLVIIGLFLNYMYRYFVANDLRIISMYCLVFVIAPLLYCTIKIIHSETKSDFDHLSSVLKWMLFFSLFILPILNYTIQQNA